MASSFTKEATRHVSCHCQQCYQLPSVGVSGFADIGEQRGYADIGEQRGYADIGEQRGYADIGEQRGRGYADIGGQTDREEVCRHR